MDALQRLDDVVDVLFERQVQLLDATLDLLTADGSSKRRLLQLLEHALHGHVCELLRRSHECDGYNETGELVRRENRPLHRRITGLAGVGRVTEDAVDDLLRYAALSEDRRPCLWMLLDRRVNLIVEVVEQSDNPPRFLILVVYPRIVTHHGLDCETMFAEIRVLRELVEDGEGVATGH